ncbi:Flavodoxin-1 [Planctomycetes bacterium Pan216]|uniref:Flavodoxin n=1 Tax=Kolteria novifilia TaxID=2527975 RepID=A0A518AWV2_9BACT|nr:Flavodoxin-1 [Planctomycetes bacterium Pan216]
MKTAIVYGSTTGNTETSASLIADEFGRDDCDVLDVGTIEPAKFVEYDFIIVGVPTWNIGEMQDDWAGMLEKLEGIDLSGKRLAIFGLGDCVGYPDTFVDAMGELWAAFQPLYIDLVGIWSIEEYEFEASKGLYDEEHFVGLVLDEDQEPELSAERIERWVAQLKEEIGAATA